MGGIGNSLVVQWLHLPCSAGYTGLIPGQETSIPYTQEQPSPCNVTTEPELCNEDPTCYNQDLMQTDK